jgi:hypothetical protein
MPLDPDTGWRTTRLGLPLIAPAQAMKHLALNEAMLRLDALVQASVEGVRDVLPSGGADGEGWAVREGLARRVDGVWQVTPGQAGLQTWRRDLARTETWTAEGWQPLVPPAALAPSRNLLGNGALGIWQRGMSGGAGLTADRFRLVAPVGSGAGWTRIEGAPEGLSHALRITVGGALAALALRQTVDVRALSAGPVTLSAWVRGPDGATIQTAIGSARRTHTIGTDWRRITFTAAAAGDVAGRLVVEVLAAPDRAGAFDIAGVQLEAGRVASAFAHPDPAAELARVRRYFWKTFAPDTAPARAAGYEGAFLATAQGDGSRPHRLSVPFPVPMRAPPVMTPFNPAADNAEMRNADRGTDCTSSLPLSFGQSAERFALFTITPAGTVAGDALCLHMTFDAEIS